MDTYEVTVVVDGFDMDSEFQNAGIECLNYEVAVGRTGGVIRVDADIEAASALDAVLQLFSDLRSIGVTVVRIDPGLVSVPEIADRAGVSRETARLWATGQRRSGFPTQYAFVGESPLWFWADVHAWLAAQDKSGDDPTPVPANIVEAINGALAHVRNEKQDGWLTPVAPPLAHIGQRQIPHQDGWQTVQVSA